MAGRVPARVIDMLKAVPLFSECTQRELRRIANLGTMIDVQEGSELTKQGTVGREFFLLIEGAAGCFIDAKRVATFGPGDFFGEMALLDRGPRRATVVVEASGRALVLDGREFSRLLDEAPSIARRMLTVLAQRARQNESIQS